MTVLVGGEATFQCAGTGDFVLWIVNGEPYQESSQTEFIVTRETVAGIRHCNLTVPTTSDENNGTIFSVYWLHLYLALLTEVTMLL